MEWLILTAVLVVALLLLLFLIPGVIGAPYVPSEQKDLKKAFTKLYYLSEKDFLVDLGAGDGVVLKIAASCGARALGVEINPLLVLFTRLKMRKQKNIHIKCGDMYSFALPPKTTVIYAYANIFTIPRLYKRVQSEAKRLNKPLYLISNAFDYQGAKPQKHIAPYYLYKIKP